jgi:flagella basal body P-ring formation protein FlgA
VSRTALDSGRRWCASLSALLAVALAPSPSAVAAGQGDVSETPAIELAQEALREYLGRTHPGLVRVELQSTSRVPMPFVAQAQQGTLAASARAAPLLRHMCVWLTASASAEEGAALPVWFAVQAYQRVWVAKRSRAARERLEVDDVMLEERDIAALGAPPLGEETAIAAWRARRALSVEHIVQRGDVEPVPPITRGADVAVEVRYGPVSIRTHALALQDGQLGDSVRLQNPDSHTSYMARVIGVQEAGVGKP